MYSDIRSNAVIYSSCTLDSLWIVFYFHFMLLYRLFPLYLYMIFLDHLDVINVTFYISIVWYKSCYLLAKQRL